MHRIVRRSVAAAAHGTAVGFALRSGRCVTTATFAALVPRPVTCNLRSVLSARPYRGSTVAQTKGTDDYRVLQNVQLPRAVFSTSATPSGAASVPPGIAAEPRMSTMPTAAASTATAAVPPLTSQNAADAAENVVTKCPMSPAPRARSVNRTMYQRTMDALFDLSMLSKAGLNFVVTITAGGAYLAAASPIVGAELFSVCSGTLFCAFSAAAWNQLYERHIDAMMKRTLDRPLCTGYITVPQAQAYIAVMGTVGTALLATQGWLPAALGAGTILAYRYLYTPMKQMSKWNTVVGAVVGAIPPLIGYAAAGGNVLSPPSLVLFSTLFLWQLPHFVGIAYKYREEYAKVGLKMIGNPYQDPVGNSAAGVAMLASLGLCGIPYASYVTGLSSIYMVAPGTAVSVLFALFSANFVKNRTKKAAASLMHASIVYIVVIAGFFFVFADFPIRGLKALFWPTSDDAITGSKN